MRECQSRNCPPGRIEEDLQQVLLRFSGWGNSHMGYEATPFWYCAKCRRRDLGQWKFYNDKRAVRKLQREAAEKAEKAKEEMG
ncbi:hypothetical protein LCGC14_0326100 [marine sediment metagenome]|uniref:Uncharacterized protein n=1 Tax=marine sediment metagenome TaxID=412755 RepID=A0A0F9TNG2_9ZZZZ